MSSTEAYVQCATCPAQFLFEEEKAFKKQCYDCYKDDNTRRICSVCELPRIVPSPDPTKDWQKICNKCYSESGEKKCLGCKQPKIKTVEKWRQLCSECWPDRHQYLRICEKCDIYPIKQGAPSWCKTCFKCYIKDKEKYWEKCQQCNSTQLVKRKTAPACRKCMLMNGDVRIQSR